jgi:hypothetical protein
VIRRQYGVELAPHRPHEHGVGRQRAGGSKRLGRRPQHPVLLVTEEPRLARMRIHRAEGEPGPLDAPPLPEPPLRDPAGPHHPLQGEQRRHVPERHVGGHQHDPQLFRREHHRDVHPTGELRQPFGVTGKGKAGEMQRVLLSRGGDDRVHFPGERELDGGLDRVSRQASRPDGAGPIVRLLAAPLPPHADRDPVRGRHRRDLILRADQGYVGLERLLQRAGGDLRSDAAGISECDSDAGQQPRCPAAQILISTYVDFRS